MRCWDGGRQGRTSAEDSAPFHLASRPALRRAWGSIGVRDCIGVPWAFNKESFGRQSGEGGRGTEQAYDTQSMPGSATDCFQDACQICHRLKVLCDFQRGPVTFNCSMPSEALLRSMRNQIGLPGGVQELISCARHNDIHLIGGATGSQSGKKTNLMVSVIALKNARTRPSRSCFFQST